MPGHTYYDIGRTLAEVVQSQDNVGRTCPSVGSNFIEIHKRFVFNVAVRGEPACRGPQRIGGSTRHIGIRNHLGRLMRGHGRSKSWSLNGSLAARPTETILVATTALAAARPPDPTIRPSRNP